MNPAPIQVPLETLIDLVLAGGSVQTGVDVFSNADRLLLQKSMVVKDVRILRMLKQNGILELPILAGEEGGMWNRQGQPLPLPAPPTPEAQAPPAPPSPDWLEATPASPPKSKALSEVERKLLQVSRLKVEAAKKYLQAKQTIKKAVTELEHNDGCFDTAAVEANVSDLFAFVTKNNTAFSYLTKEIFTYDDYLINHSINVCAIGTVVMQKFNEQFSAVVNKAILATPFGGVEPVPEQPAASFSYYYPGELRNISVGFFMHDLGKVMIDSAILNKNGPLSPNEFTLVKEHSYVKGVELLAKNNLSDPFITNITKYHHAHLYFGEERCYPIETPSWEIPPYVKVCKLADIYDAMTSKRCYKEALNPVGVVVDIFRKYAEKDRLLQFILHAFVNSVGIYPPGSVVSLVNGQMAYVLDSNGPTVLPFANRAGETIKQKADPIYLGDGSLDPGFKVDRRKPLIPPIEAYDRLPPYLQAVVNKEKEWLAN